MFAWKEDYLAMQKYIKNGGIILGHILCVFILLYSFAETKGHDGADNKMIHTVVIPSSNPTGIPASTATLIPSPTFTLTPTPASTVTPTPTLTPTPTVTPTLIPEPTITPTPVITEVLTPSPMAQPLTERDVVKQKVRENIAAGVYSTLSNYSDSWWFKRKENHVPSGSGEIFDLSKYQGIYIDKQASEEDKVIYLTIDCGYGSDNTAILLDIFKEQNVQVTFFVTGHFLKANPDEVRRMAEEGHLVGNHSVTHPDLTQLTEDEIYKEIIGCEEKYFDITGKPMDLFFRPPGGNYSRRTMQITEDLGYRSIFWSVAYFDYDKDNQPGKKYVLDHFKQYHHNGAVVLMHNDSDSNRDAMRDVILYLKEQGYRFGSLEELQK